MAVREGDMGGGGGSSVECNTVSGSFTPFSSHPADRPNKRYINDFPPVNFPRLFMPIFSVKFN